MSTVPRFSESRHPGLNWGPTDYEAGTAPSGDPVLASERLGTNRQKRAKSTTNSRQDPLAAELARLRAAVCEVYTEVWRGVAT